MINPVLLHTFCTLVDVGHFTRSADKLHMTQSGVSQHIKKLELQLDSELLVREGKSFHLTDAGQKVYRDGQEILSALSRLENSVNLDAKYEGLVKISSPGSIGLKLYSLLLDYQAKHPQLQVDYIFAPNRQIEFDIADRKYDLGIMSQLSELDDVVCQKIGTEELVLVTANTITAVDWNCLLQLGFISHPDAQHHSQLLLSENFLEFECCAQFEHKGFSNQIGLILEPVSRGFGFTVLPLNAVRSFHSPDLITVHTLANPVSEPLYLCFHRHTHMPRRVKEVMRFIKEVL